MDNREIISNQVEKLKSEVEMQINSMCITNEYLNSLHSQISTIIPDEKVKSEYERKIVDVVVIVLMVIKCTSQISVNKKECSFLHFNIINYVEQLEHLFPTLKNIELNIAAKIGLLIK